jgi:hypothetical protein
LRGAKGKEPEPFGHQKDNNKEKHISSEEGMNDFADRLLEGQEDEDVEPEEEERAGPPPISIFFPYFLTMLCSLCPFS